MVLQTKNRNRIIARPLTRTPVTLQQVHDHEPEPRLQSALQRLRTVLDAPLKTMPADIGWFDAHFPKESLLEQCPGLQSLAQHHPPRSPSTCRQVGHLEPVDQPASGAPPARDQDAVSFFDPDISDPRACRYRRRQILLREFPRGRFRA